MSGLGTVGTSGRNQGPQQESGQGGPELLLNISDDSMRASLTVKQTSLEQKVTPEEVLELLQEKSVVFGIREEDIARYCQTGDYRAPLICALGMRPVDEEDGKLIYHFDTEKVLKPTERSDGSLDFRELGLVKNISKGDVLCSLELSAPGKPGKDILGREIPFRAGRKPVLPVGTNTAVSEDGLSLLSTADGCIELLKNRINVNDVYVVRGDVGSASGNISAKGSVIVEGDVRGSFRVQAGRDITIHGMVESSYLEAGGNIVISRGVNGAGKGTLKAGGNISGKYFENAILEAGGDVYSDVLMNSRVTAGGSVLLRGREGALIGGECQVGRRVYAKNIGNPGGRATKVSIQSRELSMLLGVDKKEERPEAIQEALDRALAEQQAFEQNYQMIASQFAPQEEQQGSGRGKLILKAAAQRKDQLEKTVQELRDKLEKASRQPSTFPDFHVIARGIAYPGTKIMIASFVFNVHQETSSAKFYCDLQQVVSGPILPSDAPAEYY